RLDVVDRVAPLAVRSLARLERTATSGCALVRDRHADDHGRRRLGPDATEPLGRPAERRGRHVVVDLLPGSVLDKHGRAVVADAAGRDPDPPDHSTPAL